MLNEMPNLIHSLLINVRVRTRQHFKMLEMTYFQVLYTVSGHSEHFKLLVGARFCACSPYEC